MIFALVALAAVASATDRTVVSGDVRWAPVPFGDFFVIALPFPVCADRAALWTFPAWLQRLVPGAERQDDSVEHGRRRPEQHQHWVSQRARVTRCFACSGVPRAFGTFTVALRLLAVHSFSKIEEQDGSKKTPVSINLATQDFAWSVPAPMVSSKASPCHDISCDSSGCARLA